MYLSKISQVDEISFFHMIVAKNFYEKYCISWMSFSLEAHILYGRFSVLVFCHGEETGRIENEISREIVFLHFTLKKSWLNLIQNHYQFYFAEIF